MRRLIDRRGFTLIELLVVIAIIAILAAILFPVFMAAKRKGMQGNCAGNLKQLGIATQTYMADYGGGYKGIYQPGPNGEMWFWWPFDDSARWSPLFKYIKNVAILRCPMDSGAVVIDHARYKLPVGTKKTYAWSYTINDPFLHESQAGSFPRLSRVPFWVEENIDAAIKRKNGAGADTKEPAVINDFVFAGSDITSYKHSGVCNILFMDSHVKDFPGGLQQDRARWEDGSGMFNPFLPKW